MTEPGEIILPDLFGEYREVYEEDLNEAEKTRLMIAFRSLRQKFTAKDFSGGVTEDGFTLGDIYDLATLHEILNLTSSNMSPYIIRKVAEDLVCGDERRLEGFRRPFLREMDRQDPLFNQVVPIGNYMFHRQFEINHYEGRLLISPIHRSIGRYEILVGSGKKSASLYLPRVFEATGLPIRDLGFSPL